MGSGVCSPIDFEMRYAVRKNTLPPVSQYVAIAQDWPLSVPLAIP
jgi:hypothetical protein